MGASSIEWTDATWNPVRGCTKVSPGCKHCYAETFAERFRGVSGHPYEQGFDPRFVPDQLDAPLRWRKPRRVFVNSMSDLFHEAFADEQIAAVFDRIECCPQHTFQILTKRAARLPEWFAWLARTRPKAQLVLPNAWLGVSAEDQRRADERITHLLATPAAVRFVSVEPLLGPVDLGWALEAHSPETTGVRTQPALDWVIAGAESGNGARPMHEDWVRSLRDQCAAAGVKFFYKQKLDGRKKVSLPMLDGVQHAEWP